MFEMIGMIPENVGWVAVGFVGCLCVVMAVKVGKVIVEMVKERIEDMRETADCDTPSVPDGDFR